jgi:PAS domain S-box-containing protein
LTDPITYTELFAVPAEYAKTAVIRRTNQNEKVMLEEWKIKGTLLQQLDALRFRILQLEQVICEKTEEASKEPGRSFGQFFDNVIEGMFLIDMESRQLSVGNKAICRMLGYGPEEVRNLRIMDVYARENFDYIMKQVEKQARGELAFTKNIPVKRKDGSIFNVDVTSFPVTLGGKTYLISVFREVHKRKVNSIQQHINYGDSYSGRPLTASEIRIFELIANGMSNKEIAHLLHRSIRTVEWHRKHIMRKLGVDNITELVKRAALMGFVDLPVNQGSDRTT